MIVSVARLQAALDQTESLTQLARPMLEEIIENATARGQSTVEIFNHHAEQLGLR